MTDPRILVGNCLERLKELADDSVDSIVTDPPYELGFMGKKWDASGIAYNINLWAECLRVLKPGGHLLAFGGTRTYHRMAVAIEDAGFEIRDSIHWIYGSGFPKSLDVSKAIDKANGRMFEDRYALGRHIRERREALGLRRAEVNLLLGAKTKCEHYESDNSGFARVPTMADWAILRERLELSAEWDELVARIEAEREVIGSKDSTLLAVAPGEGRDRPQIELDVTAPATDQAKQWQGWGTALKPAHEPIVVARKPLVGTVAGNVLRWGVGGLNIDGTRVGDEERTNNFNDFSNQHGNQFGNGAPIAKLGESKVVGRWPANVVFTHNHDCGDECTAGCPVAELPEARGLIGMKKLEGGFRFGNSNTNDKQKHFQGTSDKGSAARFFTQANWDAEVDVPFRYVAKPGKKERNAGLDHLPEKTTLIYSEKAQGPLPQQTPSKPSPRANHHPTVKPVALMRWLIRLITPPSGTVLDPFLGSGTTAVAATLEGFNWIGCELTDDYLPIIEGRVAWAETQTLQPEQLTLEEN